MRIESPNKTIAIPKKSLKAALNDPIKSAAVIDLVYVTDGESGIKRIKKGGVFSYFKNGRLIKNKKTLTRIAKLVIPPAWKDVWICDKENGHLQCTGIDVGGRKQYRYHPLWNALRKETKFYRLLLFGETLPQLRKKIRLHLAEKNLSKQKVLAAVVGTIDRTGLRIGSSMYEKLYGSFGLSTLEDRHIKINGNKVTFNFKGKKGIYQQISMKSLRLAKIIRQCKEIPGKELFQYINESGERHSINSEDVNSYIRTISGGEFTSKDFRTWVGTVNCVDSLLQKENYETQKQMNEDIVEALDEVAKQLGNTRAVCKAHYVHPLVLEMYEDGRLFKYRNQYKAKQLNINLVEPIVLKILKEV